MQRIKTITCLVLVTVLSFTLGCNKKDGGGGINIFSIQDDITLGQQTKQHIAENPVEYPILSETQFKSAYDYIYGIRNEILNSGKVTYKDEFPWEIKIINRDDVINAFCTPGGYIYVYTGLIKFLDDKSSLSGVIGHEIAHADKRHSTKQLTQRYGIQTLLDVVLGENQGLITQIASELTTLKFSRSDETQADEYSVIYLCPTKFHANGAANFFRKIEAQGSNNTPAFLSTHPNPENRIANIDSKASTLGCTHNITPEENDTEYATFKASLP